MDEIVIRIPAGAVVRLLKPGRPGRPRELKAGQYRIEFEWGGANSVTIFELGDGRFVVRMDGKLVKIEERELEEELAAV